MSCGVTCEAMDGKRRCECDAALVVRVGGVERTLCAPHAGQRRFAPAQDVATLYRRAHPRARRGPTA